MPPAALQFTASRFARLYPAYWGAIALTTAAMLLLPLPDEPLSVSQVLANLTMPQRFFGVRDVDGAYWSLQIELIFYAWMLALWGLGALRRIVPLCLTWTAASLGALALAIFTAGFGEGLATALVAPATAALLHQYIGWTIVQHLGDETAPARALGTVVAFLTSVALAWGLHRWIEDPWRLRLRDWARRLAPAPAPAPAAAKHA